MHAWMDLLDAWSDVNISLKFVQCKPNYLIDLKAKVMDLKMFD